jgi:hypothetical protein
MFWMRLRIGNTSRRVRRFSYRRWPDIPSSMPQIARDRDNVLIAFNAIPMGEDGWETHLPGRPMQSFQVVQLPVVQSLAFHKR